jgi:hypothetical protein
VGHPATARVGQVPLAVTSPLPACRMPLAAARQASPHDNAGYRGARDPSPAADADLVAARSGTRYHPAGELVVLEYGVLPVRIIAQVSPVKGA